MIAALLGEFDWLQIVTLIISAMLIGINKTALPGIGVLPVVLLSMMFPGRLSTGLQLIMLAMADLMAVAYYRRKADWRSVLRLLPWAFVGLAIGSGVLRLIPPEEDLLMRRLIGGIVLGLMALNFIRARIAPDRMPTGIVAGGFFGTLLGITTQLANAAGPVASIFFLAMKLPKDKFMGCNAWFFLIVNYTKLPVFIWEGRITMESFRIDLLMIPFLLLGGIFGIYLLPRMPQKLFENIIQVLILISAVKLFF